jgi:hypothetical protein
VIQGDEIYVPAREWSDGATLTLTFPLIPRLIAGTFGNSGRAALAWGPFVLAFDQAQNPGLPPASQVGLLEVEDKWFKLLPGERLAFRAPVVGSDGRKHGATFVPFADAGSGGGAYRIWLRVPGVSPAGPPSLLSDGEESRSRRGNQNGSILDGDPGSFVVTYNGERADEDWYAVTLAAPLEIVRVTFAHGQNFHDGGWFDTSKEKPRVQVRSTRDGPWETIGELRAYPATTAADGSALRAGQTFELRLARPVKALAVRVLGKPSSGDRPEQSFSSCGELQAFAK